MPRRAEITPRTLLRDPVYESVLVTQVVNRVMMDGKKSIAEQIVYQALESVGQKTGQNPVEVLERAVKSVTPVLEVRSRRVGGANYQVPIEVPQRRARTLAVRWLVTFSRQRREKQAHSRSWPARSSTRPTSRAARSSARTTCTGWRRPTRHSRTTGGEVAERCLSRRQPPAPACPGWRSSTGCGTSASWPTSMPARPPPPSASSTTPAAPTRWARSTRAPPRWTGWCRSRSGGSRSRPPPRPASGVTIASTFSTRPGTWTLRSRSSAACACSTAPSPCSTRSPACSRSPRPCGARPTSTACPASPSSTRWTAPAPTSSTRWRPWSTGWARAPCRCRSRSGPRTPTSATSTC